MESDDGEDVDDQAEDAGDSDGPGKILDGILHLFDDKVEIVPAGVREQAGVARSSCNTMVKSHS